jgi:hypothetical protein
MFWHVSDHNEPALELADDAILVGPMEDVR